MSTPKSTIKLADGKEIVGVPVAVEESTERWSEFRLSDGTVLRAKVVVASAYRLDDFDNQGNPRYGVQSAITMLTASSPIELQRKPTN